MKSLASIVESEALSLRARHDVEEAMATSDARAELASMLAAQGGSYKPASELASTVPIEAIDAAFAAEGSPGSGTGISPHVAQFSPYPGYQVVLGEEELEGRTVSGHIARRKEQLDALLRTGDISPEQHLRETGLFPTHMAAERILQTYKNYRRESFGDKLHNILTNLMNVPDDQSYKRASLPRWLYGSAIGVLEKAVKPYKRPALAAAYAPRGDLSAYSYSVPGKDTIGLPYEYGFMSMRLIRELGLYDRPEAIDIYMESHELMHLQNPRMSEEELRKAVYNAAASIAQEENGDLAEMYGAVAKVASAFAHGHRGVGPMSVGPLEQKLRRFARVMMSGRPYQDEHGDGLYTGNPEIDEPDMSHNHKLNGKGKGDLTPAATNAYRGDIGKPLSQLESETGYEHTGEQHEAASPESETPESAPHMAAEYGAGIKDYGSPEPATNDYSVEHTAAEAAA